VKVLAVVAGYEPEGCLAHSQSLFEDRLEHGRKVARRGVDGFHDFSHRGLLSLTLLALGKGLIEPPLQLSVGTPQFDYFDIERGRHMLTPSAPTGTYFDRHPPPVGKGVRLDHLLAENVKSASEFWAF
jgi:hypothetical protein